MKKMLSGSMLLMLVLSCVDLSSIEVDFAAIAHGMPMHDLTQTNTLLMARGSRRRGGNGQWRRARSVRRRSRVPSRRVSSRPARSYRSRAARRSRVRSRAVRRSRVRSQMRRARRIARWRWGRPYFWGPRYFFAGIGFYYYPGWGFWYYPPYYCWYYPWAGYWYYHHLGYWYYPRLHFSVYMASEPNRIVFVDNDSRDDLYYAVYLRQHVGNDFYLYRVDDPIRIDPRRSAKVYLPRDKDKEYVILADKNEDKLPRRVRQSDSGKVVENGDGEIPELKQEEYAKIKVEDLSKDEKRKLKKMKRSMAKKNRTMKKAVQKIENIDDPETEIKHMEAEQRPEDIDPAHREIEAGAVE